MRKLLLFLVIFLNAIFLRAQEQGPRKFKLPRSLTIAKDYLPGKVIFKLKEPFVEKNRLAARGSLVQLRSAVVDSLWAKFPNAKRKNGASVLKLSDPVGIDRIYELKFSGSDVETVVNELLADGNVEYAEPVYLYHTSYIPNDPAYSANSMTYLDQIRARQGWDLVRSSASPVILAIVDSGSDLDHPDLSGNLYVNTADPLNGRDDDGDGFTDNYYGWDFAGASETENKADNDPGVIAAANDHGVHVSGIAGAVSDNGVGVASVSFNTARLMIVKAGPDNNPTTISHGYEGILYAVNHGARIINCSWGGEGQSSFGQDIVNYALNQGCLIVAAAGNDGVSRPQYPAAYPGVLAVGNVGANDVLNPSSNFGYYVSLCAPGMNIYSTTFNNSYGYKSGTSMASPVVAGAAALVKAYFPHLSMLQVGEQLRATADNIDPLNPAKAGQLGKGRINVYRALTESPPSIKKLNLTLTDKANGIFAAGDTLSLYVDLKNFLAPVSNLKIMLSSNDPDVTVTSAQAVLPFLGSLGVQTGVGPFKVYVKPGCPQNKVVEFKLTYSANATYTDFEGFVITLNRDFINVRTSVLGTTLTSIGKIGFLEAGSESGTLGFQYKGKQLLYESALMIGNSSARVSDNARSSQDVENAHFVRKMKIQGQDGEQTFSTRAEFDDSNSPDPLGLHVTQHSYVSKVAGKDNYLITEYEVVNSGQTTLNNVYIGLFNDWDINGGSNNVTAYDPVSKLAFVYDKSVAETPYAGIRLMSEESPAYFPLSNRLAANILANDNFTTAEKFETLSSGIKYPGLGADFANGIDVSFVCGYGPYSIPANGSVKAAFAFIGADNLEQLKASSDKAQTDYQLLVPSPGSEASGVQLSAYPNPVVENDSQRLTIYFPEAGKAKLSLYNIRGQKIRDIKEGFFSKGKQVILVDGMQSLASGAYFYRLNFHSQVSTFKISVLH